MRLGLLAAVLALLAPGVAIAQPATPAAPRSHLAEGAHAILLYPNERAVVRLARDGGLTLVSVTFAAPDKLLPPKPGPHGPEYQGAWTDAQPGTIALMMGRVGDDTLLKVESGLDKAFDYTAAMLAEDALAPEPTSVCTVLPLLASYEQWQHRHAGALLLGAFATRDTNEVICPKPAPLGAAAVT